jgi:NitT/TauT family transport system substrate-binding protein
MKPSSIGLLRTALAAGLVCSVVAWTPARAQQVEVRVARQYGIAYIPLMVMQDQHLIEKHAASLGKTVKVTWQQFTGGPVMNDALLSGNLDFAVAGPPPFLSIWARTQGTPSQVIGVASLNAMPMYLMTRRADVHSVRDFGENDRIVVSGVKVSTQAVALQMAAAKEWGIKEYDRLDKWTVAMPLSDSMALMLSGKGVVTGDFTVPPFSYREMKAGLKPVLDTYAATGGPSSSNIIYTTKQLQKSHPELIKIFTAALVEAQDFIREHKKAAAEVYLKLSGDKETPANIVEMLDDPKVQFSTTPQGITTFANFMYQTGSIKVKPSSWKELFVPELQQAPGN